MLHNFPFVTCDVVKASSKIRHPFGKNKKKTKSTSQNQTNPFNHGDKVVKVETRCQPSSRLHRATSNVFLYMKYDPNSVRTDKSWAYVHMQSGGRLSELRRQQGQQKSADYTTSVNEDREQYLSCPFTTLFLAMGGSMSELLQLAYTFYPHYWANPEHANKMSRVLIDLVLSHPAQLKTPEQAQLAIIKEAELDTSSLDAATLQHHFYDILTKDLFPHIESDLDSKRVFLTKIMMKALLRTVNLIPDDDRDNPSLRKMETPCTLYAMLWNQFVLKYLPIIGNNLRMYATDEQKAMNPDWNRVVSATSSTTPQFVRCINTGDWSSRKDTERSRQAITMFLKFHNKYLFLADLRRVSVPGNSTKQSSARQVNPN